MRELTMVQSTNLTGRDYRRRITIKNGASTSITLDMQGYGARSFALQMPDAWTAAELALEVSEDGVTWYRVEKVDGSISQMMIEAGAFVRPAPSEWSVAGAYPYIRFVSAAPTTGVAVVQAAERTLRLICLF